MPLVGQPDGARGNVSHSVYISTVSAPPNFRAVLQWHFPKNAAPTHRFGPRLSRAPWHVTCSSVLMRIMGRKAW
eukprot:s2558_g6.t1